MEESIFWNLSKSAFFDQVDACIGIVVILGFLDKSLNVVAIEIEDTEFDADVVRNCCYRHLCIMYLEMQEEILIVYVGEEVGVHHKDGIVVEDIYKLDATDSTQELWFTESANLYAIARSIEMFLYLFTKVVDSYIDVLHSIGNEAINIMVNDALTSYFEKRLWCLLSKRTKALSLATRTASMGSFDLNFWRLTTSTT